MSQKQFKIDVPSTKKKYIVHVDPTSECGFVNLPSEWERLLKELKISPLEVEKMPMEVLMTVNFVATEGFAKM